MFGVAVGGLLFGSDPDTAVSKSGGDASDKSANGSGTASIEQISDDSIVYSNGDVYEGDIVDGKRHGYGEMTYANGDYFDCYWSDDVPDGIGGCYIWYSKCECAFMGVWDDGVLIEITKVYFYDGDVHSLSECNAGALGDYDTSLDDILSRGYGTEQSASVDTSSTAQEDTSSVAAAQTVSGAVLPDINAFSGNAMEVYDTTIYSNYTDIRYHSNYNGKFLNEYYAILESYGFSLRDSKSTSIGNSSINEYSYDYTGNYDVETFSVESKGLDADNISLYIYEWPSGNVYIYYADGITMADTGDRTTQTLEPYSSGNDTAASGTSGGTSGSSGSNIAEFAQKDCSICNGSGKCQTCGGDGYLYSAASGKEDRNCYSCHNHDGKCTYCNGTGKQSA